MKPKLIWRESKRGGNEILPGDYRVIALSGALLPFNVIKDHKQIYPDGGHNQAMGKLWGWFRMYPVKDSRDKRILADWTNGFCELGDICLNYDHASNPKWMRGIRDYLRLTEEENKYIGRLVLKGNHMGFFTLERVGE